MTPQTPRAALSDADIDELLLAHRMMDQWPTQIQIHGFARDIEAHACAADRRLTAEQGGAKQKYMPCEVVTIDGDSHCKTCGQVRHSACEAGGIALTAQPQVEPAADARDAARYKVLRDDPDIAQEVVAAAFGITGEDVLDWSKDLDEWCDAAIGALATPATPTEPTK